jgi:hypothetical protein
MALCVASVRAAPPIKTSLATNVPGCSDPRKVVVGFRVDKTSDFTPDVQHRMVGIWQWFEDLSRVDPASNFLFSVQAQDEDQNIIAVGQVEILGTAPEDWTPNPRNLAAFRPPQLLRVCLNLRSTLPRGSLDAKLEFNVGGGSVLPADLKDAVTNATLAGPPVGTPVGQSTQAAKGFARELDLSGILLSSVSDTTTKNVTLRSRTTKATGDLFLAPILRLRKLSYGSIGERPIAARIVTFFTPMAIEAHASNRPITKDTLSQNRIVAGPEYELRWYLKNSRGGISSNLFRLILGAKNASDRDFKLLEPKFTTEFRPILGMANEPVVDPKSFKGTGIRRTIGQKIGRTFSPFVGFEEGKSVLRGVPASAETPLGAFTRGYLGGDLGVDFNGQLSVSTTQTMYIRGEEQNNWKHYMKSTAQWSFFSAGPGFTSGLYIAFEKGQLPPFRSPVNALTIGLRMQSSNWKLGEPR